MMNLTFHIIGDAFVDFFCYLEGDWPEKGGDSFLDQPVKAYAGGSSTNTATHLKSLLASSSSLSSSLSNVEESNGTKPPTLILQTVLNPNDHYGKILLEHTDQHGLNLINCFYNNSNSNDDNDTSTSTSTSVSVSTGHCVAIVSRGERSFMTHRGCVESFTAQHLDVQRMIETTTMTATSTATVAAQYDNNHDHLHIHVAGYFNMTGFWHGKLKRELDRIRLERKKRSPSSTTTISLVTQHDATDEWDGGMDELVPDIDFFIMNELEANKILRRSRGHNQTNRTTDVDVPVPVDDVVTEWVTFFSTLSPSTYFVVTRGADGAVAFRDGSRIATLHPAIAVQVIDPTGAGDSFTAGFLHGIWSWKRQNMKYQQHQHCTNDDDNQVNGVETNGKVDYDVDHIINKSVDIGNSDEEFWSPEAIKQGLLWGCAVGTAAVTIRGASVPCQVETILDLYQRQKAKETFTNAM